MFPLHVPISPLMTRCGCIPVVSLVLEHKTRSDSPPAPDVRSTCRTHLGTALVAITLPWKIPGADPELSVRGCLRGPGVAGCGEETSSLFAGEI